MIKILKYLWKHKVTSGTGLGAGGFTLYDELDTVHTVQGGVKLAIKVALYFVLGGMAKDPFKKD
jgi:hypothetical protein